MTSETVPDVNSLLAAFSDVTLVSRVLKSKGLSFFDPKGDYEILRGATQNLEIPNDALTLAEINLRDYILCVGKVAPKASHLLVLALCFILEEKERDGSLADGTLESIVYRSIILNITTNPLAWSGSDLAIKPQLLHWNKAMTPIISSQQVFEKFRDYVEKFY